MKRVVITGLGVISPLGNDVASFWENSLKGTSGIGPITKFDASKFKTQIAGEVKNFNPLDYFEKKEIRKYDLFTQYAVAASEQAIQQSQLQFATMTEAQRAEIGVIWATGQGGMQTFEDQLQEFFTGDGTPRFNPYFVPKMIVDIAAGVISIRNGLLGPNYCTVSACASSNTAIINALDNIRLGRAKVMIVGGSEAAITPGTIGGFGAAQALSKNNVSSASQPFDVNRTGFVAGEGAGALILEDYEYAVQRGATILAEIAGGGMAADAYHLTGTSPDGLGAKLGMLNALKDAGLNPEDIDYINAHATSTGVGDLSEIKAISAIFGNSNTAISATKSMTGHLLGAAGAIESIYCVMAVQHDTIPPTMNVTDLDPEIPQNLQIVLGEKLEKPIRYALNNSFGFGGHTASSIFKKFEA
ncbi:beta-ketoacyl-ACP synthase II [Flectobacillus roseus]|uniref:3-oxoacyl-[acyl-carrier-protein] synthase 2 n=1 Tax=Flectobacillus roseus TaxID=502259 RepID=A0ABT6Y853_9BACT|nr:beta-ketoacyl-ACP synthase II [Flectobacillus roseus]MDI9859659.1 beta-ketoacyl-ACP synthase II [Flectobacillus roseus]